MHGVATPLGELRCYASGSGALSYTYCRTVRQGEKIAGASPGDAVSIGSPTTLEEIPPELVPAGHILGIVNSNVVSFAKVFRVGADSLSLDGEVYRYVVEADYGTWKRYDFLFDCDGLWLPLYNENTRAALRFFLTNEDQVSPLLAPYLDYSI